MTMSNPPQNSSPQPSGSSSPESYQTKRVRNNMAVKKCREAKRKQEKEMLDAVAKQKELNKRLEEEYEKAKMEEQMLRAMLPFCTTGRARAAASNNTQIPPNPPLHNPNINLASFLSQAPPISSSASSSVSPANYFGNPSTSSLNPQNSSQK